MNLIYFCSDEEEKIEWPSPLEWTPPSPSYKSGTSEEKMDFDDQILPTDSISKSECVRKSPIASIDDNDFEEGHLKDKLLLDNANEEFAKAFEIQLKEELLLDNPNKEFVKEEKAMSEFVKEKEERAMSEFERELYPIHFDEPPSQLKDPLILTFWWTSAKVRDILSQSPWRERLLNQGETPYFCFHNGFCDYFETGEDMQDHYKRFKHHKLTRKQIVSQKADADIVKVLRQWGFPKVY